MRDAGGQSWRFRQAVGIVRPAVEVFAQGVNFGGGQRGMLVKVVLKRGANVVTKQIVGMGNLLKPQCGQRGRSLSHAVSAYKEVETAFIDGPDQCGWDWDWMMGCVS